MGSRKFLKRPVSLLEQITVMKQYFPNFHLRWRKNIVTWIGNIQPTHLSKSYRVRIRYSLYHAPDVHVLKPQLTDRSNDAPVPHTYPGQRLCLYHPLKKEWNHYKYIAITIVPWISLWLFYYELWQVTGEWMGGGEHPNLTRRKHRSPIYLLKHLETKTKDELH